MSDLGVTVLGLGAIGGFLAAVLWRNGISVTCVAREATAEAIVHSGIRLESATFGDFVAYPRVVTRLNHEPDILFVTTKATTLCDALERVDPYLVANAIVVPLLNGIEHMQVLQSRYGKRIVAASVGSVEVIRLSRGHVVHSTPSVRIELASDGDVQASRLSEFVRLLSSVGIATELLESEAAVLWRKLVRLNAIACATSASDRPVGYARSDPWWRKRLEACVREGAAVAAAEGVRIDPETVMTQIDRLPAGMLTSMQRDIASGNASELDAIAGAVVRAAARYALDCPTIESLIARIQSRIARPDLRQVDTL